MKRASGDLWRLGKSADAIVITTNGTVKRNGQAVMGRGCAKEAALRWKSLPRVLGNHIWTHGNVVHLFTIGAHQIITYPVKHQWWERADLALIAQSALDLLDLADHKRFENVVMPRPGCGNGGLNWWDVEPLLQQVLDDRFTAVTFGDNWTGSDA